MPNGTYGGMRGKDTSRKENSRFPLPTRFLLLSLANIIDKPLAHFGALEA